MATVSKDFIVKNGIIVSNTITSTDITTTSAGGGSLYLNGSNNRIDFNTSGVSAPTFTTISTGTKIVLYPNVGAASVDYALGIESGTMWSSVSTSANQFKWYAGTTSVASLSGTGTFSTTNISYTGTLTGGTGVIAIGTNQIYKDSSGKVGIGTASPNVKLEIISTDAILVPKGTAAQQPTGVAGYLRFNTDTAQFEGHNGITWSSVGGSAITNDTTTSTNIYPLCASSTSGTALNVYTSNSKYLYKPSTGELSTPEVLASNGMILNNSTVSTSYTIPTGYNATATGPMTIASGAIVTIPSGSRWMVL